MRAELTSNNFIEIKFVKYLISVYSIYNIMKINMTLFQKSQKCVSFFHPNFSSPLFGAKKMTQL